MLKLLIAFVIAIVIGAPAVSADSDPMSIADIRQMAQESPGARSRMETYLYGVYRGLVSSFSLSNHQDIANCLQHNNVAGRLVDSVLAEIFGGDAPLGMRADDFFVMRLLSQGCRELHVGSHKRECMTRSDKPPAN